MDNKEDEILKELSDFQLVEYFKEKLVDYSTGGKFDDKENLNDFIYKKIRIILIKDTEFNNKIPNWLKSNRNLDEYWHFIKNKFIHYAERREFLKNEFDELLNYLEIRTNSPMDETIIFNEPYIQSIWQKAIERKINDPEGAITMARTLLESVLKYILDEQNIEYNENAELYDLYKEVSKSLKLAPEQHQEKIFKQILGNANGIISGLGSLRNKLGDAHGKGRQNIKPQERHSELAVNLGGTMAIFLYKTYIENQTNEL